MKNTKKCRLCGECCTTVGIEIETPETQEDFDYIKWYIYHKNLSVYVDRDGTWNVEIKTNCKHLGSDKKCKIYDKRPAVCREFSPDQCDLNECDPIDAQCIEFTEASQVDDYVKELKKNNKLK